MNQDITLESEESNRSRAELALPVADSDRSGASSAERLLRLCLDGNAAAWDSLFHCCQPGLLQSITAELTRHGADRGLADEVAAQVWHSLLDNDAQLLSSFDFNRGCRLSTYLNVIASKVALQFLRSNRRQRDRDQHAGRPLVDNHQVSAATLLADLQEFLSTLTPREQSFCRSYLLAGEPDATQAPLTQANVWQLSHRVRQKLETFIDAE